MAIASVNPATGEVVKTFEALSDAQLEEKVQRAADTFLTYRKVPFAERARCMVKAAEILEADKELLGRVMTLEMGKPLRAAIEEAAKCATGLPLLCGKRRTFLADEIVETGGEAELHPLSAARSVLAVMPWNFPFWQVFRFAAPALMAGNVGLLKHASNVPQCALKIEEIFKGPASQKAYFRRCSSDPRGGRASERCTHCGGDLNWQRSKPACRSAWARPRESRRWCSN